MIKTHKAERDRVENETWDQIEGLKETNKNELAMEVDKGMKQKSELTLIRNEQKHKQAELDE